MNIPKDAVKVKKDPRGLVLAEGEVTGHFHGIEETSDAELYKLGEELILANTKEVEIKHQEHKKIKLKPQVWDSGIVVEYDPISKMERKVLD